MAPLGNDSYSCALEDPSYSILVLQYTDHSNIRQVMILAKQNDDRYGELLEKISGCVFFGVPHRGANIAYWANIPAQIITSLSLGFVGNVQFLESLRRDSDVWRSISNEFIQRAKRLHIRTFYETKKIGNQMVRDRPNSRMT